MARNQPTKQGKIIITTPRKLWPHELRIAQILAESGHEIKFLGESNLHNPDILLDGIEFEIKSPKSSNTNSLEHLLKKAIKQSPNIIIDTSRLKNTPDRNLQRFLVHQFKLRKQIKRLILITKKGKIIDISSLI